MDLELLSRICEAYDLIKGDKKYNKHACIIGAIDNLLIALTNKDNRNKLIASAATIIALLELENEA